jgi:hypothetical protein
MKLGPSELPDALAGVWALGPEPAVDWVCADDEVFCFDCELAEAFLDCVLAVEPRVELAPRFEEPLPDLPAFFAAVRLGLLALPSDPPSDPPPDPLDPVAEPAVELAEAPDDAELPELLAAVDEPDEGDCERAAALGGCGAGVNTMESRATRNHSLRPDAL